MEWKKKIWSTWWTRNDFGERISTCERIHHSTVSIYREENWFGVLTSATLMYFVRYCLWSVPLRANSFSECNSESETLSPHPSSLGTVHKLLDANRFLLTIVSCSKLSPLAVTYRDDISQIHSPKSLNKAYESKVVNWFPFNFSNRKFWSYSISTGSEWY